MNTSEEGRRSAKNLALICSLGAVVAMAATLVLLGIFSLLIHSGKIPANYSELVVICSAFIGVTLGASTGAKANGKNVLPTGVAVGGVYLVLILLLTALGGGEKSYGEMSIKMAICAIGGGVLGGVLRMDRGQNSRSRRKRR